MAEAMLSTTDNPFDVFTQFDEWNAFDMASGYYTLAYLSRIIMTSDELSEADQVLAVDSAIDEIVALNITGNYIKVFNNSDKTAPV
jgi:hypothetical protein